MEDKLVGKIKDALERSPRNDYTAELHLQIINTQNRSLK